MSNISPRDISDLIASAKVIAILQADNPDGDSLASALALEDIIGNWGKEPVLYCGMDIPKHLQHLSGWDRVQKEMPKNFDLSIVVDCSSRSLFEIADKRGELTWVFTKPMLIIDHHKVEVTLPAKHIYTQEQAVSTGEIIYDLAKELDWQLSDHTKNMITVSILSDSLGLMTDSTSPHSIRVVADLVESGVKLAELDDARRQTMRKSEALTHYKGQLLQRIAYTPDYRIAHITIPWEEIEQFSSDYNPSMLVIDDMRLTEGTHVAIAFKTYKSSRVTAKIRCNYGYPIARELSEHFGGGGHPYASGFKIDDGTSFEDIKQNCINKALELLDEVNHETI
ncbi:MAG: DHH family phosphoesterase [Patescibacteria group bacterium]